MNFRPLPTISIEVESMRHAITTCLTDRHEDLLKCVNAGIDAALVQMPFKIAKEAEELSLQYMEQALESAIKDYWESGNGRAIIDKYIADKFDSPLNAGNRYEQKAN